MYEHISITNIGSILWIGRFILIKTVNQNHTGQKEALRFWKAHLSEMGNLQQFI